MINLRRHKRCVIPETVAHIVIRNNGKKSM